MIAYPAMLDVPTELAEFLAALLAAERVNRGTRTGSRALSCTDQAVFALVWFRESRDMRIPGRPARQVAAQLDVNTRQVERWVARHRGGQPLCPMAGPRPGPRPRRRRGARSAVA